MAQHYLLPCDCGNQIEVSTTQAGATVSCVCGQNKRVPSLASMRHLSRADIDSGRKANPKRAPNRYSLLWAGALILVSITVVAGLRAWNQYHYDLAKIAFEQRDFEQAGRHLRQRKTLGLDSLSGGLLDVQTARRSGNVEEAARGLKRLQRRFSSEPSLQLEEQLLELQQGNLQRAQDLLAAHVEHSSPEAPWVLEAYIKGSLLTAMGAYVHNETYEGSAFAAELVRTRQAIEQWLALRPGMPDQVEGLVWSYQAHLFGHFVHKAHADLEQALELEPHHRQARTMLAMHLAQEHPEESAIQWQALHDEFPDDISVSLNLADVRRRLGQLEEAQSLLENILDIDRTNLPAIIGLGRIAMDIQDTPTAEEWFRTACRENPDSVEANLALSRCLRAAGKVEEADRLQKRVEQLQAEHIRQREAANFSSVPERHDRGN